MQNRLALLTLSVISGLFILSGCTKPYVITSELEKPLMTSSYCIIEDMKDELPADLAEEKKPTREVLDKFNDYLIDELQKTDLFGSVAYTFPSKIKYKVTGAILDYTAGSGFLRFMFGAWAGSSKVVVSLKLLDYETGEVLYAGNFKGIVTSWAETGDKVYKQVAHNFAQTIEKKHKKLIKEEKE